jgi:hypothetical protein
MGLLTNIGRQRTGNPDIDRALALIQREFEQVYKQLDRPTKAATQTVTTVSTSTSSGGGGSSVSPSTLDSLTDVTLSSPASGDILQYGGSVWSNTSIYGASGFIEAVMRAFGSVQDDPTGWPDTAAADTTITVDEANRKVTIAPTGASYYYYIHGVKVTVSASKEIVFPDDEGLVYFFMDSAGDIQTQTGFDITLLRDYAYICNLYWDATNNKALIVGREQHGHKMDWWTHRWIHLTQGAAYSDGLGLTGFVIGDGSLDTHAQFGYAGGTFFDEDILHAVATDTAPCSVRVFYRIGSNWRAKAADSFPFVQPGSTADYAGTSRPAYNLISGGSGSLVEVTNTDFVLIHLFAVNDASLGMIAVVGQNQYATLATAREGAKTEMNALILLGLPAEEIIPVGSVILECRDSFTNSVNARVVQDAAGNNYQDFRVNDPVAGGGGTGSGISDLNGLTTTAQTFAKADDTNVTLTISSATSTHTFTLGWTGTLAIARGGTSAGTAAGARVALLPSLTGNNGKVLAVNAGETDVEWVAGGAVSGITTLNSLTAATQSFAKSDDTNVTLTISSVTATHTFTVGWTGTLAVARGGTGSGTAAGARVNLLPAMVGKAGYFLKVNAGETDAEWATVSGGSAAGSNTHVQYNSSGAFAGDHGLQYDNSLWTLLLVGNEEDTDKNSALVLVSSGYDLGVGNGNLTGIYFQRWDVGGAARSGRWEWIMVDDETGSNAGSDLFMNAYDDAGSSIGQIMAWDRSSLTVRIGTLDLTVAALTVADGGTGASTAAGARVNLLPTYTSNGGMVLALNAGATDVEWVVISSSAVSASRPAAGAAGRLYFPTDGFGIERDNGSAWVKWGGYLRPMVAPLAASNWTWVNQGTATVTDYSNSLRLYETGRGVGTQERLLVRSTPATPWTFTVCFMAGLIWNKNYQGYGLCFRQSSDGKIHSFKSLWNTGNEWAWYSTKWNSATSFSADYSGSALQFAMQPWIPHWMQIKDDGTNRKCLVSTDGYTFVELFTIGRTDFLTANQYGFQWTGEQTATPYRDICVWVLSAEIA